MEELLQRLEGLMGCREFKQLIRDLYGAYEYYPVDEDEPFFSRAYLFSINDGDGLSTQLEILSKAYQDFVWEGNVPCDCYKLKVPRLEDNNRYNRTNKRDMVLDWLEDNEILISPRWTIVCVDIREWIGLTETPEFRVLVSRLRDNLSHIIPVFRVPALDRETLEKIRESIDCYMSVTTVYTTPYSLDEYKEYAIEYAREQDIEFSEGALEVFEKILTRERNSPNFWGFKSIECIVDAAMMNNMLYEYEFDPDEDTTI